MAGDLKSFFGRKVVEGLADDFSRALPRFKHGLFVKECLDGLDKLELLARGWHIAEVLKKHLPREFPAAAGVIVRSLRPETTSAELTGMDSFRYLPHIFYIAKYGIPHFEEALHAQYELTKRFTAEFSIRFFLIEYPDKTYSVLQQWLDDPNVHVRRLVSEGTRPRLPWAPRLRVYQANPKPVLALLERLKDDPELYVRRSVANSLNDIGKDHPDLAVETCARWLKNASPERQWLIRHALRSLVKKGHPGALKLMGAGTVARVRVSAVRFDRKRIRIGESLTFSFDLTSNLTSDLTNTAQSKQSLLVDYAVHFVKANGSTGKKVFKLKRLELAPRSTAMLSGRISFREMTTRKHYPGQHRLEAIVNGKAYPLGSVQVLRPSSVR